MGKATLALVASALMAACVGAQPSAGPSGPPDDHLQIASNVVSYHLTGTAGLVTSIVQVDAQHWLLCDRLAVYRLTRESRGYTLSRLGRPSVTTWSPTGLAYRDGLLSIANDLGHEVLQARLSGDNLALVRRVTHPVLGQAQSVVSQQDGSLVVADQSGGAVLKFRPDGTLQWRTELAQARGVTESGGFLYASSLSERTISKLDETGKAVKVAGSIGVSKGRYLWPVGLSSVDERLLVTDAHNGRISVLDRDLRVLEQVGGNGPGMDAFDFPFATLPVADGYMVVDTFKGRVVHLDRKWVVKEQMAYGRMVPVGRQRPLVFGTDARPTTYDMLPGVDLPGAMGLRTPLEFRGGFNGLDQAGAADGIHLDVTDSQLDGTSQTWAQRVGSYIAVGSSQNGQLEVIDPMTGMFTYVEVGPDAWWHQGTLLLSGNVRRELADVISRAVTAFTRAKQLLAQGATRQDAFNQALNGGRARNWSQDLTSPAAKLFLRSGMTREDGRRYFDAALQQRQQRVVELLEVRYLSGA